MGFVPIPGIRVDSVSARRTEGIAQSCFVVESSARADDESYSPSQQESERSLADEETTALETQDAPANVEPPDPDPLQGTQINCIA